MNAHEFGCFIAARTPQTAPIMTVAGVTKRYGEGEACVHALRGIDLAVLPSALTALTGPSGSGKSTLLNIVGLLDAPNEGTVSFAGQSIGPDDEPLRQQLRREYLGFVFQNYNLVPSLSAVENVELALFHLRISKQERRARAIETLELVDLAGRLHHRPREMSGGQQQRVAVARALVRKPRLVIADEPTANLDVTTALRLMDLMKELHATTATSFVVSTHDPRLLPHFTDIIPLEDGRIVS